MSSLLRDVFKGVITGVTVAATLVGIRIALKRYAPELTERVKEQLQ